MTIHLNMRKKLAAVGVGTAVLLGTGGAVAWAQTSGSSSTTTPAATAPTTPTAPTPLSSAPAAGQKRGAGVGLPAIRAIGRRTVHADLVVKDKSGAFVTMTIDRGTVSAVNATSVTLDRPDGKQVSLTINNDTKVHGVASVTAIQTGKDAIVVSRDGTATQILQAKS